MGPMSDFEPIRIVEIIENKITKPRNDGTAGSALYRVPFKLSAQPPAAWAEHFPRAWDRPSTWTSKHRPGICTVNGDVVWLNGTTLEEVAENHKATLELALEETNRKYAEFEDKQRAAAEQKQKQEEAHTEHVKEAVKKIKF
jgi:hypothetical protein